jgi:hypothetical protein
MLSSLVLSGAYIGQEMIAEFGKLPPAFLPIGAKRLFELQFASLPVSEPKYLTVPNDYIVDERDDALLKNLNVKLIAVDPSISLRLSLLEALSQMDDIDQVQVLHGDTLLPTSELTGLDEVSTYTAKGNYTWAYVVEHENTVSFHDAHEPHFDDLEILSGFFRFSSAERLRSALRRTKTFVDALNEYSSEVPLTAKKVSAWYDYGHLPLYYQSKRNMLTARAFNTLRSDGLTITKLSKQTEKMRAEAHWYEKLPDRVKLYTPKFLGEANIDHMAGYKMEYLFLPTLAELFVLGKLPSQAKRAILSCSLDALSEYHAVTPDDGSPEKSKEFSTNFYNAIYYEKTQSRLRQFYEDMSWDWRQEFEINGEGIGCADDWIDECFSNIPETSADMITLWHGDYFFGNMFFDHRSDRVIAIDPRGAVNGGKQSLYGDKRYDLAKLAHSVIGKYDWIISDRCQFFESAENSFEIGFSETVAEKQLGSWFMLQIQDRFAISQKALLSLTILLFLSMLPLHSDSPIRQKMLFANALRLLKMMHGEKLVT